MKDNDLVLLLIGAALLFFLWRKKQAEQLVVSAAGAGGSLSPAPPGGSVAHMTTPSPGLTPAQAATVKAAGQSFRAPTANGTAGGVPFGMQKIDRTQPRPAETAYKPRSTSPTQSSTSRALNNSTLNKAEQYSIAGGVAAGRAFGIPTVISKPIAQYGNPVALGRYAVSGGKAVGNFFSSIF